MTWPVGFLFTPQQLQGSVKYSSGVRLGNWREDDALDDMRLMDYVKAKETGSLLLTSKREKLAPQLAPTTLSTISAEGFVKNGDVLQLSHAAYGIVATSMGQLLKEVEGLLHPVTCTASKTPVARNTLRIVSMSGAEGEPIVYGQDVCFVCEAGVVALLASARPVTAHLGSLMISKQDVYMLEAPQDKPPPYDCAWKIQPADVDLRLSTQGRPVGAADEFVLVHAFTNKRLAACELAIMSDMGMEAGICCHTYSEPRKVNKLLRESRGFPNHNFGTRCETNENIFSFVYA